jgi:hypothetical protein
MVAVASSSGSAHGSGVGGLGRRRAALARAWPQGAVGARPQHEAVLGRDAGERVVELGVDQQHRGARVLDDVADLVGGQPEVHRHEHPAPGADPEERDQEAGGVVGHDRHPLTPADPQAVERRRLGACQLGDAGVGQLSPRRRRLIGLVDHAHAVGVDERGALEVVGDRQRNSHGSPS